MRDWGHGLWHTWGIIIVVLKNIFQANWNFHVGLFTRSAVIRESVRTRFECFFHKRPVGLASLLWADRNYATVQPAYLVWILRSSCDPCSGDDRGAGWHHLGLGLSSPHWGCSGPELPTIPDGGLSVRNWNCVAAKWIRRPSWISWSWSQYTLRQHKQRAVFGPFLGQQQWGREPG